MCINFYINNNYNKKNNIYMKNIENIFYIIKGKNKKKITFKYSISDINYIYMIFIINIVYYISITILIIFNDYKKNE